MIEEIYLDLDGVIYDFNKSAQKLFDIDLEAEIKKTGINLFFTDLMKYPEYVKKINEAGLDFWLNLELFPWAKEMFEFCFEITGGRTYFLTSCGEHFLGASGKLMSIARDFGVSAAVNYTIITRPKYLLAKTRRLLVDDSSMKCNHFIENGGISFVFPSQYLVGNPFKSFKNFVQPFLSQV